MTSRSPKLWGTSQDVARRFAEFDTQGVSNWLLYVGKKDFDKGEHIRRIIDEVTPAAQALAGERQPSRDSA